MKLKDPHTALHKVFLGAGNRHKEWLICISIVIETSDKQKCILSFVQLQRTLKQTGKKKNFYLHSGKFHFAEGQNVFGECQNK